MAPPIDGDIRASPLWGRGDTHGISHAIRTRIALSPSIITKTLDRRLQLLGGSESRWSNVLHIFSLQLLSCLPSSYRPLRYVTHKTKTPDTTCTIFWLTTLISMHSISPLIPQVQKRPKEQTLERYETRTTPAHKLASCNVARQTDMSDREHSGYPDISFTFKKKRKNHTRCKNLE